MAIDNGRPAFPLFVAPSSVGEDERKGMSLRDYFAAHAPAPNEEEINFQMRLDKSRNPHNDSHRPQLRDRHEIIADLAYRHADAMLKSRSPRQ